MTISLVLEHRSITLSATEQALAKATASRYAMRLQLQPRINDRLSLYKPQPRIEVEESTLKCMIDKYSEQLVFEPLKELQQWFAYSSGLFLQPGYPPLFYNRSEHRTISPSKSAVAAVGEGVAGLLAQRLYRCRKLARPIHDYPDIVMEGEHSTYLVEAKATVQSAADIKQVVEEEVIRIAAYTSACAELDPRPVVGLLVGTALVSELQYACYITEVLV